MTLKKQYLLAGETGGTKTVFTLLAPDGRTIAENTSKGVASLRSGMLPVREYLEEGIRHICEKGAISPEDITFCCFSLGGPNQAEVTDSLKSLLPSARLEIGREADGDLALFCAAKFECSACLMAGTGTVAVGKGATKKYFAGGWGPDLDDYGGGTRIGLCALSEALKCLDGRAEHTDLVELITPYAEGLALDSFSGRMELKSRLNSLSRQQIAAFLPDVYSHAGNGDKTASGIISAATHDLALLAAAVMPSDDPGEYMGCLCIGGIFKLGAEFNTMFTAECKILRPNHKIVIPGDFSLGKGIAGYTMMRFTQIRHDFP